MDRGAGASNFPRTPRGRTKGCFLEYPLRSSEKNVELASSSTFLLEQSSWSLTCLASQVWSRARKDRVEQFQTCPYYAVQLAAFLPMGLTATAWEK